MRIKWEVQHHMLCDGWANTWSDDNGAPIRYATRQAAESALAEYLVDVQQAAEAGEIMPYDSAAFRIAEITL